MIITEPIARLAMRLVMPEYTFEECGFMQTDTHEWTMQTENYEFKVCYINNEAVLTARFRSTGRMSMVCVLRQHLSKEGVLSVFVKRKYDYRELRRLKNYIA